LGLSYKPNVDDERNSPSYVLIDLLEQRGAKAAYHDPYVPVIKPTREHSQFAGRRSAVWNRSAIQSFDVVLIATNHSCINYHTRSDGARCVVDTRSALATVGSANGKVWKA